MLSVLLRYTDSFGIIKLFIRVQILHQVLTKCKQNKNEKKLARSFDFTFRYIDNAFSLNISKFDDIVDPTDTTSSVSYRI